MDMEETQIQNPKPISFSLSPRRHLQSKTYRTLVRIFSHCYDESQHPLAAHVHNDLRTVDGVNKSLQETERRASDPVDLVDTDDMEPSVFISGKIADMDLSFHDNGNERKRYRDTQMAIDQIEQLMSLEENDDYVNKMDLTENKSAFSGSQNLGNGGKQMLMDELNNILKGNEDLVYGRTSKPLTASVVQYQSGITDIEQSNNQAKFVDCQLNISNIFGSFLDAAVNAENSDPKPENEGRFILKGPMLDIDPVMQHKEMEVENSVSARDAGNNTIFGDLKVGDMVEKQDTSPVSDTSREAYAMVCKDKELKGSFQTCDVMDCAISINEDEDIEEGEISGDYRESDDSMDIVLRDAVVLKDKQASEACIEKKEFPYNKANEESLESDVLLLDINDSDNSGKREKSCESDRIMISKAKTAVSGVSIKANRADGCEIMVEAGKIEKKESGFRANTLQGQALEEDATKDHQITPTEEDGKVRKEKKRGPPSKERKAKKKQKERMKRAEKNRQLGVKRLKLPPILKLKAVSHCRHYIMGRCHEGDKCKFSHDTVPLTKSKPCCHFARHSCMKGDDCPFDHQLSKYPCSNFVSNGSCIRGDCCMFSHKMPPKEDVADASNAITPELKRVSLPDNSYSHKKLNRGDTTKQNLNSLSYFNKIHSLTGSTQSVKVTNPKQSEQISKGTAGSSPIADLTKNKQGVPAPSSNAVFTSKNTIDENASCTLQNSNKKLNRTSPVIAPKGINFLSFGKSPSLFSKSPSDDSSTGKATSLPLGTENGANSSQSNISNLCNQASSAPRSGLMLKGVQPEAAPKGINFLSFGKSTKNETGDKGKISLSASGDNRKDGYVQQKRNVIDIPETSSATSPILLSSLVSSIPFPDHVASRDSKDPPLSVQKALLATLAFAAKYEAGMKLNPSFGSPVSSRAFDKETRNKGNSGDLESDPEKAAKILDFLSSIGGGSSSSSENIQ